MPDPKKEEQFRDAFQVELGESDVVEDLGPGTDYLPRAVEEMDPIEVIAAPRGRGRKWDRDHPAATFRGVDLALDQSLRNIAEDEQISKDQVANAFLGYAYHLYKEDVLKLTLIPGRRKFRLFEPGQPLPSQTRRRKKVTWRVPDTPTPPKKKKKAPKKRAPEPDGRVGFVAYRLEPVVRESLKELTDDIVAGDVVNVFLARAIEDYAAGLLALD